MENGFKKHFIRILVVVSVVNLALIVILIMKIDQLEKEKLSNQSFNQILEKEQQSAQSSYSSFDQEIEQLKVDLATYSTYDLGDINGRLTKLEIIGNTWLESNANEHEVKIVYGKVTGKDYYQELESGVPIVSKGSDEEVSYQLHHDYKTYAMGQFGFVLADNEEFVQSVVLNDDFECTYILINNKIKYIIMGSFTE